MALVGSNQFTSSLPNATARNPSLATRRQGRRARTQATAKSKQLPIFTSKEANYHGCEKAVENTYAVSSPSPQTTETMQTGVVYELLCTTTIVCRRDEETNGQSGRSAPAGPGWCYVPWQVLSASA